MIGQPFNEVLVAAQSGAAWACTLVYRDLAGPVTGYVRQRGAAEPDDVASETFLQVFRDIGSFEGDESAFRSWVFTIAHRRVVDTHRRRSRRPMPAPQQIDDPGVDTVSMAPGPAAVAVSLDTAAKLRPHLDALKESQREVVLLRVVGGLTVEETAVVVGRRADSVRQLQRRGLRALAASLEG